MKSNYFKTAFLLASMLIGSSAAFSQIGPVVEVSQTVDSTPTAITDFVSNNFPDTTIKKVELKTMKGIYEVDLNNGYDLYFTQAGQWLNIEAPDNSFISHDIISKFLPVPSIGHLRMRGDLDKVEEISFKPEKGFKVKIEKRDDKEKNYFFDLDGKSIKGPKKMKKQ